MSQLCRMYILKIMSTFKLIIVNIISITKEELSINEILTENFNLTVYF